MENIPAGSMARLTAASSCEGRNYPQGTQFEVEDFVSSSESEDGVAFYWGSHNEGINNVYFPASVVEQVMSKDAMEARCAPSPTEIMEQVWGDVRGESDGIGLVTESTWNKDNTAEFFVEHENGVQYVFTLAVTRVVRV